MHKLRRSKLVQKLGGILLRGYALTCPAARPELRAVLPSIEELEARGRGDPELSGCYADAVEALKRLS